MLNFWKNVVPPTHLEDGRSSLLRNTGNQYDNQTILLGKEESYSSKNQKSRRRETAPKDAEPLELNVVQRPNINVFRSNR